MLNGKLDLKVMGTVTAKYWVNGVKESWDIIWVNGVGCLRNMELVISVSDCNPNPGHELDNWQSGN